jgi:CRISPR-associated protein Cas1
VVADGLGPRRREGSFFRASSPIKRVVLIGRSGSITLEAVAWLHDTHAALIHLDWDGTVLITSAAWRNNDGRLRRQQALATTNGTGIAIAKSLVSEKLRGQLDVLQDRPDTAAAVDAVRRALGQVEQCATAAELMRVEAEAAAAYWQSLAGTTLTFARRDLPRIPPHWSSLGPRSSPITRSPRRAATPGQALLNLAYGAATAEAAIACSTLGLDPSLGVLHADQRARDSMALDLLEPCRPIVDQYVLELIASHTFAARDFREDGQGQVWVTTRLTRQIGETCAIWRRELAPFAERVAKTIAASNPQLQVPTLLTQSARSRSRDRLRRRPRAHARPPHPPGSQVCRECGTLLEDAGRTYCDACLPAFRARQRAGFSVAGPAALAKVRDLDADPAHGREAGTRRAETMRRRHREAADWSVESVEPDGADVFGQEVLRAIQGVPLRQLVKATGLSLRYCALIRRGERVPHPRHWAKLRETSEGGHSPDLLDGFGVREFGIPSLLWLRTQNHGLARCVREDPQQVLGREPRLATVRGRHDDAVEVLSVPEPLQRVHRCPAALDPCVDGHARLQCRVLDGLEQRHR